MKIHSYHTAVQAINLKENNTTISSKTLHKINKKITCVMNSPAEMEAALQAAQRIKNIQAKETVTSLLQKRMQVDTLYSGKITINSDGVKFLAGHKNDCAVLEALSMPVDRQRMKDELENSRNTGTRLLSEAMLTEKDAESIRWYTSTGYQYINESLRKKEELIDFLAEHKVNVLNGMHKLGPYQGEVYRALYVDDIAALEKKLQPGQVVADRGFLSTTTCMDFAKDFRGGKGTVIYAIQQSSAGYDVSGVAQLNQAEVLHEPGITLRIKATKLTDSNLFIVLENASQFHPGEKILDMASGKNIGLAVSHNMTSI